MSIEEAIETVKKHQKFLITAHINPEGDSIGSQLAVYRLLRRMNKMAQIVDESPIPSHFKFLPDVDKIYMCPDQKQDFEVVIILDCPDTKRIGKVIDFINKDKIIINIDHHISNEIFGRVNWVDGDVSSVGEMVYEIYEKTGYEIDKEDALCLYVAILTDTGSFRYANTKWSTHKIVSELLKHGLNPDEISEKVYERNSLPATKLLGLVLSTISMTKDGKIAWLRITREMFDLTGASIEETGDFINFARAISGVKVAFILTETEKEIRVSFRSKGKIDVNKIASVFGGGGHVRASGCRIKGNIDEVEKLVLDRIRKNI